MPIHFSIGFVLEHNPKMPFECLCAVAHDIQYIEVVWTRGCGRV